jgi:5-methylcytosine-specific restriction endonuclease McrA
MRDKFGRFLKGTTTRTPTSISTKCQFCLKNFMVQPHRFKSGRGKFCSKTCAHSGMYTEEVRLRMSLNRKGKPTGRTREKCHFWKGGVTPKSKSDRMCLKTKNWRKSVFERDDYTCQECGKRGGGLQAHHIKQFSIFKELRFDINNGLTLCIKCHKKTDSYGNKLACRL